MGKFKKGLSEPFVEALKSLASTDSWWRDVLEDDSLLIAVRHEYINVYWQGQSIFKIGFDGDNVSASTHPKYLLNPELSEQVSLDVHQGDFGSLPDHAVIKKYHGPQTLKKMKIAAALFSGSEKKGVHTIACDNPDVIDVEIAFDARSIGTTRNIPRIDIAALIQKADKVELVFWEAKLFSNKELRARDNVPPVVEQIEEYKKILSHCRDEVLTSYSLVASNMVAISEMSRGKRSVGPAIKAVADGVAPTMSTPPQVGLIVYGFDADQRDGAFKKLKQHSFGEMKIKARGEAKGLVL